MHLDLFNKTSQCILFMCHCKNNISTQNLHFCLFIQLHLLIVALKVNIKSLKLCYILYDLDFSPPKPFHFISYNFSQLMQTLIWKMDSSEIQCFVLVLCFARIAASAVKTNCVFDVKRYTFNFLIKLNKMLHSKLQRVKLSLTFKILIFLSI